MTTTTNYIELLLEGFLNDRTQSDDYVIQLPTATGWEVDRKGYSSLLLKEEPKDETTLVTEAFRLCSNRVRLMSPNGKIITLAWHNEDSFTNGKLVFVSTEVFDNDTYSYVEKTDVVLGLTTHELAHVLHTDFKFVEPIKEELLHTIWNIIEDERIERIVSFDSPGFSRCLAAAKRYYFDFKYKSKEVETENGEFGEIFGCFFRMVRYPSLLNEETVAKHYEVLLNIKACLLPYPTNDRECVSASRKVYQILAAYASANENNSSGKEGKGKSDGKKGLPNEQTESGEELMKKISKLMQSIVSPNKKGSLGDSQISKSVEGLSQANRQAQMEGNEEMEVQFINNLKEKETATVLFQREVENRVEYMKIGAKVAQSAKVLSEALRLQHFQQTRVNTNLRHGAFDESKIVDAVIGSENIYMERLEVRDSSIPVVLMIDQSGSMSGSKIEHAKEVAITFVEALKKLKGIDLYVYGYTSDDEQTGVSTIRVFQEQGYSKPMSIGNCQSHSNNADGICIRAVVNRVRKKTASKALLLIISDGQPSSDIYQDNIEGINDTAQAVIEAERKNFVPIQIGINVRKETQAQMFKRHVNFIDGKTMVASMSKLLRKALSGM